MRAAASDAIIVDEKRSVLLVKRKNEPGKGKWATPGGFIEDGESAEEAAVREAEEETGVAAKVQKLIGVFSSPSRDPRGTISIAYLCTPLEKAKKEKAGSDAQEAKWFPLEKLPELAFDHRLILENAKSILEG